MSTMQTLFPIADIATSVGHLPEAVKGWCSRLGITIEHDWANREVVTDSDARRIREEIERAGFESAQLHEAYSRYLDDRERRQREAGEQAFQKLYQEGLQQQRAKSPDEGYAFYGGWENLAVAAGSDVYIAANNAAEEARQRFAHKNPQQTFEQFARRWKKGRR